MQDLGEVFLRVVLQGRGKTRTQPKDIALVQMQ
jgi:hypothetical protein